MKKLNRLFKNIFIALSVLAFASCDVGLGKEVDTKGPELNITYPAQQAYVKDGFSFEGEVTDNESVKIIEITCTDTKQVWKMEPGNHGEAWYTKAASDDDWSLVPGAIVTGDGRSYSFEVPVDIDVDSVIQDYVFEIIAKDKMGNTSVKSKDTIKVTVDTTPPIAEVLEPALETAYNKAESNLAKYVLHDNMYLSKLINGTFTIKGWQNEDNPSKLKVILDNGSTQDPSEENVEVYCEKEITDSSFLRNWELDFKVDELNGAEIKTGKHLVRVVVIATDKASQTNEPESQVMGWFVLWPEADEPWIEPTFGEADNTEAWLSDSKKAEIYPNYNVQGQAWDDDGLESVTVKIYSETGTLISTVVNENEKKPPYMTWTAKAPAERGNYYADISVVDKNGVHGESLRRYFHILDINPPVITIESPVSGDSVLGDKNGNFTISGYASDDAGVKDFKVVRIKPGKESTQLEYLDGNSSKWANATSSGKTDADGNKVWVLSLGTPVLNPETDKYDYPFTKTFNLFNDFGINGTENNQLKNEVFIFCISDNSGSKTVKSFSISGDTEAPSITLDKIKVINGEEYNFGDDNLSLPAWNKDGSSRVTLSGTWGDNSFSNYKDLNKINKPVITWNGVTGIEVIMDAEGNWTTNQFKPSDSTTASISVSLTDWGGNTSRANGGFYVESNEPELTRISTLNSDGSYTTGTTIQITMEFNRPVTFIPGISNPTLTLNTKGKVAAYASGNGSTRHVYEYTIAEGDDVEKLNVTGLNANGATWSDGTSQLNMTSIPTTGVNSLGGGRSINIDTIPPEAVAITSISADGYYKAGKSIFVSVTFSEKVSVSNPENIRLKLNSGTTVYADNATVTSDKTMMLSYTVKAGENASPLKISQIIREGAEVKDVAGNILGTVNLPSTDPFTGIIIDTKAPDAPVVKNVKAGIIYGNDGVKFTVEGEEGASIEYSIDNGESWATYSREVSIIANGKYDIIARQTDKAGNLSDQSKAVSVTIDKGELLTTVSSSNTDGTYTYNTSTAKGDVLGISLTFRKKVTVSDGAYLKLNTTPEKRAVYDVVSSTDTVKVFKYTVGETDMCNEGLNVTDIAGTFKDESGNDVTEYCTLPESNNLIDNRTIKIVTGIPVVQSVVLNNATNSLEITFNCEISKNSGTVTITQNEAGYRVPACLSTAQYNDYKSFAGSYYEEGTNGSSNIGKSDISKKYVLKYTYDSDNAALKNLFITNKAHVVEVPVLSNYVTVQGTKLVLRLQDGFALKVKGAAYTVDIPEDLVIDVLGHTNAEDTETRTITTAGVESPVIRVNKTKETISGSTITQPLTATVKIDCLTPNATIYYVNKSNESKTRNLRFDVKNNEIQVMAADTSTDFTASSTSAPTTSSSRFASEFTIGSTSNTSSGYKVLIRARATKDNGKTWSDDSYEAAYRSVVIFNGSPAGNKTWEGRTYKCDSLWIRGGDCESGGVSTPGFPFSWNSSEYDKVRAMTNKGSNVWYWVTWNIGTTAYFGFVSGNVPNDAAEKGPGDWVWASCAYVALKLYYPINPGESLTMPSSGFEEVNGTGRGTFGWQEKHCEHR